MNYALVWRLVKQDRVWRSAPYWTAMCATGAALMARSNWFAVVLCCLPPMIVLAESHRRATRFQAALPISGRELIAARILTLLGVWAIVSLASGVSVVAFGGTGRGIALPILTNFVMVWAAGMVVLQAVRIQETHGPPWLIGVVYLLFCAGISGCLFPVKYFAAGTACIVALAAAKRRGIRDARLPAWFPVALLLPPWLGWAIVKAPVSVVAGACGALALAAIRRIWLAAPRSFQLAPAAYRTDSDGAEAIENTRRGRRGVEYHWWRPVLKSLFLPQGVMWLCCVWMLVSPSLPFWLMSGTAAAILWQGARYQTRWFAALPVDRRTLMNAVVALMLMLQAAGYYLASSSIKRHPLPWAEPKAQILGLAALSAWVLLGALAGALSEWKRLRRLPLMVRKGPAMVLSVVLIAQCFMTLQPPRTTVRSGQASGTGGTALVVDVGRPLDARWFRKTAGGFAQSLPNWFCAALIGAGVLIPLALALDKVHREAEYRGRLSATVDDSLEWRAG